MTYAKIDKKKMISQIIYAFYCSQVRNDEPRYPDKNPHPPVF